MWHGWISLITGVWLIVSGIIPGLQDSVNLILFGLLAAIIGFFFLKGWEGTVNGILGVWLFISGFVSGLITAPNFLLIGIVISVLSLIRIFHLHRGTETKHKTA
jgi:hypothetical protein